MSTVHAYPDPTLEALIPWLRQTVRREMGKSFAVRLGVDDCVQDVLVGLLQANIGTSLRDPRAIRSYVRSSVRNRLRNQIDYFAADKRKAKTRSLSYVEQELEDGRDLDPSDLVAQRELSARVRHCLEALPLEPRRLVLGRIHEGASFGELGRELGLKPDAARMRFNRVIAELRMRICELGTRAQAA